MDLDHPALRSTQGASFAPVPVKMMSDLHLEDTEVDECDLKKEIARLDRLIHKQKWIRMKLKKIYLLLRRLEGKHSSRKAFLEFRRQVSKMKKTHIVRATLQVELVCQ